MREVQLYCHKAHALYGMTVPQPGDLADQPFIATSPRKRRAKRGNFA